MLASLDLLALAMTDGAAKPVLTHLTAMLAGRRYEVEGVWDMGLGEPWWSLVKAHARSNFWKRETHQTVNKTKYNGFPRAMRNARTRLHAYHCLVPVTLSLTT